MNLTVLIPAYNEVNTIEEIVKRVQSMNIANEILIVDDGSQDGTRDLLEKIEELENILYNEAANDKSYFSPWPETDIYEGSWDVFGLYAFGEKLISNCSYCPKTTALIEQIPGLTTAGFSALAPGSHGRPAARNRGFR